MLGASETRIRNLRRDTGLRFGPVGRDEALRRISQLLFQYGETRAISSDGLVCFELDDPLLQREFEQAARDLGYYTDTSFNRSIIRVHLHVFVAVTIAGQPDAEEQVRRILNREASLLGAEEDTVASGRALGDRVEWFLAKHKEKRRLALEVAKAALGVAFPTA